MSSKNEPWRTIGWDGIQLQVPVNWHPAAVYSNYLLFEHTHQPICALKWQQIRGQLDFSRIMGQLQKSMGQAEVLPWLIPLDWQAHLKNFTCQGFSWQANGRNGTGLVLYDQDSSRSILFQFYGEDANLPPIFRHLLESLQIQPQDEKHLWSMFDIAIHLPREAQLTEHEFLPGSFRLTFSLADHKLSFYRFKPAAELLKQQSLSIFGKTLAEDIPLTLEDSLLCQWQKNAGAGFNLLARLQRKPTCSTVRLWQIVQENAILGLKVQGNSPFAGQHFETLCADYSTC